MRTKYMSEAALSLSPFIVRTTCSYSCSLDGKLQSGRPPTQPEFSKRRGREELHDNEAVIYRMAVASISSGLLSEMESTSSARPPKYWRHIYSKVEEGANVWNGSQ